MVFKSFEGWLVCFHGILCSETLDASKSSSISKDILYYLLNYYFYFLLPWSRCTYLFVIWEEKEIALLFMFCRTLYEKSVLTPQVPSLLQKKKVVNCTTHFQYPFPWTQTEACDLLLLMKRDGESYVSLPCGSFKGQYMLPLPPLLLQQSVFSNAACPRGRRIMRSRDPADHHGHCSVSRKHTQEQQQTTTTFVL